MTRTDALRGLAADPMKSGDWTAAAAIIKLAAAAAAIHLLHSTNKVSASNAPSNKYGDMIAANSVR
jgi:hypothetical protein